MCPPQLPVDRLGRVLLQREHQGARAHQPQTQGSRTRHGHGQGDDLFRGGSPTRFSRHAQLLKPLAQLEEACRIHGVPEWVGEAMEEDPPFDEMPDSFEHFYGVPREEAGLLMPYTGSKNQVFAAMTAQEGGGEVGMCDDDGGGGCGAKVDEGAVAEPLVSSPGQTAIQVSGMQGGGKGELTVRGEDDGGMFFDVPDEGAKVSERVLYNLPEGVELVRSTHQGSQTRGCLLYWLDISCPILLSPLREADGALRKPCDCECLAPELWVGLDTRDRSSTTYRGWVSAWRDPSTRGREEQTELQRFAPQTNILSTTLMIRRLDGRNRVRRSLPKCLGALTGQNVLRRQCMHS